MINESFEAKSRPIMTILSLALTLGVNLLTWPILIRAQIENLVDFWDVSILFYATVLLLFIDFVGLILALIATWRKESRPRLRRIAYAISLLSFPLYLLVLAIF